MKKTRALKPNTKKRKLSKTIYHLNSDTSTTSENHDATTISKIVYTASEIAECTLSLEELMDYQPDNNKKLWINVHGVHDKNIINAIGKKFNLHPLVIEDILNTEQRPKLDTYKDYLFLETRNFYYESETMSVSSEQISIILGHGFLLTFQERATGAFEPIRERLRASRANMRDLGIDYLAYALIDNIVDRYFKALEAMGDDAEKLEEALLSRPGNTELQGIHQLKHASIELRRSVWPLREVINNLTRNEANFFQPATMPYLRDIYDHTVNFIESLEAIRDSLSGLMDIYMTSVSQRVNLEVRALTVVAMLFMPATLIAGIFGMNFVHMPWIDHYNGFWYAIGIMAGIAFMMGLIFWRRQWLTSKG
jgi:magnesium transporter